MNTCFHKRISHVIDLDLENFFGSIDQEKLVAILKLKIKDERFLKYLVRMLKAGILRDNKLVESNVGTPQGSMTSPILANIFGHYCLDVWFENIVGPRCLGKVKLVRYCDDAIILCERKEDLSRVLKALKGRLDRFGLKLNEDKTRVVSFNRRLAGKVKQETFNFLGFTFFIGKSRKGIHVPKVKTNTKTFSAKLKNVELWCRRNRDTAKLVVLWKVFCSKLQGHINYYCISYNTYKVKVFVQKARKIFLKWMNRRSQRRSMSWEKFLLFESSFPPPKVRASFRLF